MEQPQPTTLTIKFSLRLALIVWLIWAAIMSSFELWHLFDTNWFMSLTMALGSFIAGATSEGGGAIAFPVMTLIFDVPPSVAKDFSLMIQSVGMSAAAITIFAMKIRVDLRAIALTLVGAVPGFIVGTEHISPLLPPAVTKIFFVSFWLGFGLILHLKHRSSQPRLDAELPRSTLSNVLTLITLGTIGGTATGITGCGVDIVAFSYLVLRLGLHERVATPTSVVLMACMSMVGFAFRLYMSDTPIAPAAWNYWWVSVPVVVLGAPLGALFIARCSRNFIISLLFTIIVSQFIGALIILPMTKTIVLVALITLTFSIALFATLAKTKVEA